MQGGGEQLRRKVATRRHLRSGKYTDKDMAHAAVQ